MCKYCEENHVIWFKNESNDENKILGAMFKLGKYFENKKVMSIYHNNIYYDCEIKYCPFCGKNLRFKTLYEIKINRLYEKAMKKILNGNAFCKKCNKQIKNTSAYIRDKNIYCFECFNKISNEEGKK